MIRVLRSPKIIDIKCNVSFRRLISETISTWSKKTPDEIERELNQEELIKRSKDIVSAVKDGYSSILEMPIIHVSVILPRISTLSLVSFPLGSNFLQQSLRYTLPLIKEQQEKMVVAFIPESLKYKEHKIVNHIEKSYAIYNEILKEIEVLETRKPEEDARYHLPLCIGTFISCSINLSHLVNMLSIIRYQKENKMPYPSIWEDTVNIIYKGLDEEYFKFIEDVSFSIKLGKFYPNAYPFISSQIARKFEKEFESNGKNDARLISYNIESLKLFSKEEIKDLITRGIKEGNFKEFNDIFFLFATKESIVSRHQIIRHRTVQQQSISIYDASERMEMIIPPSIRRLGKEIQKKYEDFLQESISLYEELKEESYDDAIMILPSNLALISTLRLDGYNVFNFRGFLGNRCCELAQSETQIIASLINSKINEVLINEGFKELTNITHANCFKLRRCPELEERAIFCTIFKSKSFEKPLFS